MSFDYEQSIWGQGEASRRWSHPASFRLRQALRALVILPPGSKVLEVGSGAGQFIRAIKKIRPELECYGSDISRQAIGAARQKNDGVTYMVSGSYHFTCETSPCPLLCEGEGRFDAVLIFDVLEHVDDPAKLLGEVRRVLKPGGILYAFVPCEGDGLSLWHWLEKAHLKRNLTREHAGHIQYFSRRGLMRLFGECGFRPERVRYSEHCAGQLAGIAAFVLMHRAARRRGLGQLNNEAYFSAQARPGGLAMIVKRAVNSLIFFESVLLARFPSPNVHVTLQKML